MKKILALLLAALMILPLAACNKNEEESTEAESTSANVETTPADPEVQIDYTYTTPNKKYTDEEVHILVRTQSLGYHDSEESSGSTKVDMATFSSNTAVEEAFGVELIYSHMNGYRDGQADFSAEIRAANNAGEDCYDIISPAMFGNDLVIEQQWADLQVAEYLNTEKGWWSSAYIDSVRMNDKLYTITGDLSVDLLRCMTCVYFNKDLYNSLYANDAKYSDLYAVVDDGGWTLDTMMTLAKKASVDVNSDGSYSLDAESGDIFGLAIQEQFSRNLPTMSGIIYIKNDNGDLFTDFYNTRTADLYDAIRTNLVRSNNGLIVDTDRGAMVSKFTQNQILFYGGSFEQAGYFTSMASDYGILINPKYSENEEYVTGCAGATIFAIPVGAPDYEMSTVILEALGYQAYKNMRPAFFGDVLQGRVARDEQSYDMLEKIRETLYVDFALAFANDFTIWNEAFDKYLRSSTDTLATFWAEFGGIYNTKLEELMGAIE